MSLAWSHVILFIRRRKLMSPHLGTKGEGAAAFPLRGSWAELALPFPAWQQSVLVPAEGQGVAIWPPVPITRSSAQWPSVRGLSLDYLEVILAFRAPKRSGQGGNHLAISRDE